MLREQKEVINEEEKGKSFCRYNVRHTTNTQPRVTWRFEIMFIALALYKVCLFELVQVFQQKRGFFHGLRDLCNSAIAGCVAGTVGGTGIGTIGIAVAISIASPIHVDAHLIEGLRLHKVHLLVDGVGVVLADQGDHGLSGAGRRSISFHVVCIGCGNIVVVIVVMQRRTTTCAGEWIKVASATWWNVPSGQRLTSAAAAIIEIVVSCSVVVVCGGGGAVCRDQL